MDLQEKKMKTYLLLALLTAACSGGGSGHDNFQQAPLPECDITESEPNNDYSEADFAGVMVPGDFVNLCGRMTAQNSQDWFHFFTPASQAVSLVVETDANTTPVARIWVNTVEDPDTLVLRGQFFGVPGKLFVSNWPVLLGNNGYFVEFHGIGPDTMYHVETWSEGWITIP
jgi:hypothetical protein